MIFSGRYWGVIKGGKKLSSRLVLVKRFFFLIFLVFLISFKCWPTLKVLEWLLMMLEIIISFTIRGLVIWSLLSKCPVLLLLLLLSFWTITILLSSLLCHTTCIICHVFFIIRMLFSLFNLASIQNSRPAFIVMRPVNIIFSFTPIKLITPFHFVLLTIKTFIIIRGRWLIFFITTTFIVLEGFTHYRRFFQLRYSLLSVFWTAWWSIKLARVIRCSLKRLICKSRSISWIIE